MSCPSRVECSMYADGALPAQEAAEVERHVADCAACRAAVESLVAERHALMTVLQQDEPVAIPAFHTPWSWRDWLGAAAVLALLAAGPMLAWSAVSAIDVPAAFAWLNPFSTTRAADVAAGLVFYLTDEGTSTMTTIIETIGGTVLLGLLVFSAFALVRVRGGRAAMLATLLAAIILPTISQALEIRRSEQVLSVPAGETIDDTLIALGDSVEIDGTVTGDLIAFGRRVNIRGTVQGQVVTGAQSVTIDGDVGGSVLGFAESLTISQGQVAHNLFGFGREVTTTSRARIDGNAVVFAANGNLTAPVGIDAMGFANELDVSAEVQGDLTAFASRVTLLAPASVGGNVIAHVPSEDALQVSTGATVGGEVRTEIREGRDGPGPDADPGLGSFYAWQVVRFGAAFLTGLVVLALASSLRRATPGTSGAEVLTTGAIGLVTAVATPIIAVLVAITLIGLPVALVMFLLWGACLYFAEILFSHYLGRKLFDRAGKQPHFALSLLVGLLVVMIVTSIPIIGGIVSFLLTIIGLGMLVIFVWGRYQRRSYGGHDADVAYP